MDYIVQLGILFSIYAIIAIGLNLLAGYAGLVSIMHAGFIGIGAYATAILTTDFELNFFISVLIGVAIALFISFLLGLILVFFSRELFSIISLTFNVFVFLCFQNWESITRGPFGRSGIPRPSLFGMSFISNINFLMLSAMILLFVYILSRILVGTPFGRIIKAIREDELCLSIFGYHTARYKLLIFMISAAIAAIGGSLYASYNSFIEPNLFDTNESLFILTMVIIGGLGSLEGALAGSLFNVLLISVMHFFAVSNDISQLLRQLILSLTLIFLMMKRSNGLIGNYHL